MPVGTTSVAVPVQRSVETQDELEGLDDEFGGVAGIDDARGHIARVLRRAAGKAEDRTHPR